MTVEEVFKFLLLSMAFGVGVSCMAFMTLKYISSIPTLLRVFITNGVEFCQMLFCASIEKII